MDPDPTPFFIDFKDAKKNNFSIFFLITYLRAQFAHHVQSKKVQFLLKLLCENVILQALFQSAQHIYWEREGSGARSGKGSVPLTN